MKYRNNKFFVPLVLLVLVLALSVRASEVEKERTLWEKAGFTNPRIEYIDTERFYTNTHPSFTHHFDLTVVIFRDTDWRKKVVLKRLKKVADTYAQCGIRIGRLTFVTAGAPGGMVDFGRPGGRDKSIALRLPPTVQKPVFFYFRSIPQYNAYAWPEHTDNDDVPDALKNTAWFSLSVAMPLNRKIRHPNYVSEAHELGHILLDSLDHPQANGKNLMGERYDLVNDQLTAEQCRKIKAHHLVKPAKLD
jgi:hypothetical protein